MVFCFWVSHELSVMCALPHKQDEFGKSRDGEETIHGAPGQTNDHSLGIH